MNRRLAASIIVSLFAMSPVYAATVRIDMVGAGMVTDIGRDGTGDYFDNALPVVGTIHQLISNNLVATSEPGGLCSFFGCNPSYSKTTFVEFGLASIVDPIQTAYLVFSRFADSGYAMLGGVGVSGYEGDGSVGLSDYNLSTTFIEGIGAPTLAVEHYMVDVTSLVAGLNGDFAGFRFDMLGRGMAQLLDTSYGFRPEIDFAATPAPYLLITSGPTVVPVPASGILLLSCFFGLVGLFGKRRMSV